jgi:hypothetical protein
MKRFQGGRISGFPMDARGGSCQEILNQSEKIDTHEEELAGD